MDLHYLPSVEIDTEHLSTAAEQKEKDRIDWRRSKVQQLSSQGYSQRDSANTSSIKWYRK
jgi:hypothetical protein